MSQVHPLTRHQIPRLASSAPYLGALGAGASPRARAFAAASLQYLSQAAAVVPTMPFSVRQFFYDSNNTVTKVLWSAADASTDSNYFAIWTKWATAGKVGVGARNAVDQTVESTTTYASNTWNQVLAVYASATDRRILLNGGGKNTDTNSVTPVPTRMGIGVLYRLNLVNYWDGAIGATAIWNVALTDAEALALATPIAINGVVGMPPASFVRPDALIADWPIFGNGSPELDQSGGGKSLTLVNAPTKAATRPPIVYPPGIAWATGS